MIPADVYVADGDSISSRDLPPGCYDLYVEDEFGCWSNNDTDGNLRGGLEFTWTVFPRDLVCQ